jgi:hypothetical protein
MQSVIDFYYNSDLIWFKMFEPDKWPHGPEVKWTFSARSPILSCTYLTLFSFSYYVLRSTWITFADMFDFCRQFILPLAQYRATVDHTARNETLYTLAELEVFIYLLFWILITHWLAFIMKWLVLLSLSIYFNTIKFILIIIIVNSSSL